MKRTASNRNSESHHRSQRSVISFCLFTLAFGIVFAGSIAHADPGPPKNQVSLGATVINATGIQGMHPHYSDSKFEISRGFKGGAWYSPGASLSYGRRLAKHFDLGVLAIWDLYKDDPTINQFRLMVAPTLVFPLGSDKVELNFGLPIGGVYSVMKVDMHYDNRLHSLFGFSIMFTTGVKVFLGDWGAAVDVRASVGGGSGTNDRISYGMIQLPSVNIGIVRRF